MKTRIKQIRKEAKLSQEAFAQKLNVSRNFIAQVETDRNNLSNRTIADICRVFDVNKDWLLTGEGEMHGTTDKQDKIADLTAMLVDESEDSFKYKLLMAIADFTDEEIKVLEDLAKRLAE